MAVIKIAPKPGGRSAVITREQPTRVSVEYLATTNNKYDGPQAVLSAMQWNPAQPWFGRPYYVGNDLAFMDVESITCDEDSVDSELFHVTVNYQNKEDDDEKEDDQGDQFEDPLKEPYEISGSFSTETKAVEKAQYIYGFTEITEKIFKLKPDDGKPKFVIPMNSSGEPFVPGLTDVEYIETIRITKNDKEFPAAHLDFLNTPNEKTWTLTIKRPKYQRKFFPNTVKLVGVSYDYAAKNGKEYVRINYVLAFKRTGWDDEILDRGLNERFTTSDPGAWSPGDDVFFDPISRKPRVVLRRLKSADDDYPLSTPVSLDGNGKRLEDGGDPVYATYRKRALMDYSKLKI